MRVVSWIAVLLAMVAGQAVAAGVREGVDYLVYQPQQATENKTRIEITEFFSYGCSHCFHYDPMINAWLKTLPKDATFRRVPAVFPGRDGAPASNWATPAKVFYALEAMGLLEKMHSVVFNAIHKEGAARLLRDDSYVIDWMGKHGVDAKLFADTYNSFSVQAKVRRAMQVTEAHGLDAVPVLVVDGRYRVIGGASEESLVTANRLIDMARKERTAGK
jgi:protein dithiol oxidoreductase (disulfide-forming)